MGEYKMHQLSFSTFELKNNLILFTCNINGRDRNFILDTGSHKVILNSKYQESHSYENYSEKELKGATGTISKVGKIKIDTFTCGNFKENNIVALTMDLSQIEKVLDTQVYGLIGYEFISKYNIYLDYQNQKIGFWNEHDCNTYSNENAYRSYKFEMEGHLPIIPCKVGSSVYRTVLDTGANANLFDIGLINKLEDYITIEKYKKIVSANQDSTNSSYPAGSINSVEVEGLGEFSEMSIVFSDLSHLNQNSNLEIHGILGYQFLSQAKFIISFTRNKLYVVDDIF